MPGNKTTKPTAPDAGTLRHVLLLPSQALDLLGRQHISSRQQDSIVHAYAAAMREGGWIANGQPVIVSRKGRLLDGLHRLAACVETGIPLDTLLAEGVDDEAFHSIDQHRRRSLTAMLWASDGPQRHMLAHLIMRLAHYQDGTPGEPASAAAMLRPEYLLRITSAHRAAVAQSMDMARSPLPEPLRTMLLYMGNTVNPALTARFMQAVMRPSNWSLNEPGVLLRGEIDRGATINKSPSASSRLLALALKALNATLTGEPLQQLTWRAEAPPGQEAEPFPHLQGYPPPSATTGHPAPAEPGPAYSFALETIGEDLARRYIDLSPMQRRPIGTHVEALARDIRRGRWAANAQPICFSAKGILLNGRHRLMAIIEAKAAIQMLVVRGLPEAAYATYDIQLPRPIRPILAKGKDHATSVFGDQPLAVAMASLLWRHERRPADASRKRAALTEIHEILADHPRLLELRGYARKMVEYGRASVIGYGAYVIERSSPEMAQPFLEALATGANLPADHPVLALRRSLQKLRREEASQVTQLNALMAGWRLYQAYVEGMASRSPRVPE